MNLLILGANSDLANALAREFAGKEKANIILASRKMDILEKKAKDVSIRFGVEARPVFFDALDFETHVEFYQSLDPKPDGVVVAFGLLGSQEEGRNNFSHARKIIETNFLACVSILEIIAADFEKRGHGFIIGISSVAGMRGRQSNYFYGAAKGALSIYLSGLRNRLSSKKIRVMTVLPGFIQTKMTEDLGLPGKLTAAPEEAAADIHKAFVKKKDFVYTKWFWKWIMAIIKNIPEPIFKKMKL